MKLKWSTDDTREENIIAWQGRRIAELEQELAALREAVAWERECGLFWDFGRTKTLKANDEALESLFAARAAVDALVREG